MGDGMNYVPISVAANDAQLVEQLKMSGEIICTAFSVPAFKIGLAPLPSGKVSDLPHSMNLSVLGLDALNDVEVCGVEVMVRVRPKVEKGLQPA